MVVVYFREKVKRLKFFQSLITWCGVVGLLAVFYGLHSRQASPLPESSSPLRESSSPLSQPDVTDLMNEIKVLKNQVELNKQYMVKASIELRDSIDDIDRNVDTEVSHLSESMTSKITDIVKEKDEHFKRLDNIMADIYNTHSQLEENMNTEITEFKGTITKHAEELNKTAQLVDDLTDEHTHIKTDLTATKQDIQKNNELQNGMNTKLEDINKELEANGIKTENQAKELQTKTGRILEQRLPKGKH